MVYSQKYCLVSFIESQEIGYEFTMNEWPMHITLADVFAIDRLTINLDYQLACVLQNIQPVQALAQRETTLGDSKVVLIQNNDTLQFLHETMVSLLESSGGVFNSPEFIHKGFLPHCTIQNKKGLHRGDMVTINSVALIDMFVKGNWQKRKIINIITLNNTF